MGIDTKRKELIYEKSIMCPVIRCYATLHECYRLCQEIQKEHRSQTLPSWLPDDAPAPDPNSEISIVHFYINEDGETIVYDPETEVIPYSTAYGDAGTAAIYWVNRSQIYWGITSYTKGLMTFAGDVTTNRGGFYLLGDIEFDGSASGNIMGVTTKRGTNTATLSGFMIDAKGVSFTAPDVSSSLTY